MIAIGITSVGPPGLTRFSEQLFSGIPHVLAAPHSQSYRNNVPYHCSTCSHSRRASPLGDFGLSTVSPCDTALPQLTRK